MTNVYKIVNIFEKLLNKKANLIIKNNKFKNFNININKCQKFKNI